MSCAQPFSAGDGPRGNRAWPIAIIRGFFLKIILQLVLANSIVIIIVIGEISAVFSTMTYKTRTYERFRSVSQAQ